MATTMSLAVCFAKGGISGGVIRFYEEYSESPDQRNLFSSTILIRSLILSAGCVIIYLIALLFAPTFLGLKRIYTPYFITMSVYLFIRPLNILIENVLRASGKTLFYNVVSIIEKGCPPILTVLMVLYVVGQFSGYFIGLVLAEMIVSLVLFTWFFSTHKIYIRSVSKKVAMDLAAFGFPLLLSEILYLLVSNVDRYLILFFQGEGTLGLYSVGYNMAFFLSNMILFPLTFSIVPLYVSIYRNEGQERTEVFLNKVTHYMILLLIPAWFGYYAVSRDLFIAFASKKYEYASAFSALILLGSFCYGMNSIFSAGLFLQKKTRQMSACLFVGFLVNVLGNILLLPKYGVVGASVASLVGYLIVVALMAVLSHRYIVLKISISHILYYLVLSLCMFIVLSQIETHNHWINLILKIMCGVIIIIPGVLYKEREVLDKVSGIARQGLNRFSGRAAC